MAKPNLNQTKRCFWCTSDSAYIDYHDKEWGVPLFDADKLFEMLILESFQAGLSWLTVLKKRAGFRCEFAGFNPQELAGFSDQRLEQALLNSNIIRNRSKVFSVRTNAKAWLNLSNPVDFLWDEVGKSPVINHFQNMQDVPTQTAESINLSNKLKKAGFVRIGPTTCYALMQAVGMVMDHFTDCFRYSDLS